MERETAQKLVEHFGTDIYVATKDTRPHSNWRGQIWLLKRNMKPQRIAIRWSAVDKLCFHKGQLYDVVGNKIYKTFEETDSSKHSGLINMGGGVTMLESFGKHLYIGSPAHDRKSRYGIFKLDPENLPERFTTSEAIFARRDGPPHAMCKNPSGTFLDASGNKIYYTKASRVIAERPEDITGLCYSYLTMHDTAGRGMYRTEDHKEWSCPHKNQLWIVRDEPIIDLLAVPRSDRPSSDLYDVTSKAIRSYDDVIAEVKNLTAIVLER